jgi:hypothetical protein
VLIGALSLAAALLGALLLALCSLPRDTASVAASIADPAAPVLRRYAVPEAVPEALPEPAALPPRAALPVQPGVPFGQSPSSVP